MSVPVFDMFEGMTEFFTSQSKISRMIGKRLYDTLAPERIVALENTQVEPATRMGPTVEWEDLSGGAAQNLAAESTYNVVTVGFRFFAFTPEECRKLFVPFYDALGVDANGKGTNRYEGTWNDFEIKLATWDMESRGMIYDETFRMAVLSINLVVRFASS